MIGDCLTAALVSKQGSIDWLCLPHFDSPACFAALVGTPENGHWSIAPADPVKTVSRNYRDGSLILETHFETESGSATLIDCMVPGSETPELLRVVVGTRGEVRMKLEVILRFDYGSIVPWVRKTDRGISAIAGPDTIRLSSDVELQGKDMKTEAEFTVKEGRQVSFEMGWFPSHKNEPAALDIDAAMRETEKWWGEWSGRCTYQGKWKDAVVRSLVTLKGLTFLPTGGIVASPTTSLPEQLGGVRNWDYRFCWVRDATFTLQALLNAGYMEEAREWREWLLRAIAGSPSELNIVYGLRGERRLTELELPWLEGYEKSAPVRIGNAAYQQFQLDIFGEVFGTLHEAAEAGLGSSKHPRLDIAQAMLEFLETGWEKPDHGIWEMRGPRRHFVHSKMMAWVAVDRLLRWAERRSFETDIPRWEKLRSTIHEQVCRQGFDAELNSFVQYYGGKHLDASVLMMPLVGFLPPDDARVIGTVRAIETSLMENGFVGRYTQDPKVDGLPHGEGTFLPCSFWLVDNYVLLGRHEDAVKMFERLLEVRNDVGLLSEEYDAVEKRQLGNFPQAFSHVGLVNTAFNLTGKGKTAPEIIQHVDGRSDTARVAGTPLSSSIPADV
jgi:GH15 family glucan-1,4-alpha-glucosidase